MNLKKSLSPLSFLLLLTGLFFFPSVSAEGVGYKINNGTLHLWNEYDNYYFNVTNGCFGQFTNHYNDYWSKNVFGIGVEINNDWQYYYSDTLCDWNYNIYNTSEKVYFNLTRIFEPVNNYPIGIGIIGELGKYDDMINLTFAIKNLGNNQINNNLRLGWHIRDIRINNALEDTYGWFDDGSLYGNLGTINNDLVYHNEGYSSLTIGREGQGIIVDWNENADDYIIIHGTSPQYNAPISLILQTQGLNIGQTKNTTIRWLDACVLFPGSTFTYPSRSLSPTTINTSAYPNNQSIMGCYPNVLNGQGSGIVMFYETNQTGSWVTIPTSDATKTFDCSGTTCGVSSATSGNWYYKTLTGRNIGEGNVRCRAVCGKVSYISPMPNPLLKVVEPPAEDETVEGIVWFMFGALMLFGSSIFLRLRAARMEK